MSKKNSKQISNSKTKKNSLIPLYVQAILSLLTIIAVIVYFINKNSVIFLQITLGLTMLTTGYNNYKSYHRPFLTVIYFVVGLILLALALMTLTGI